MEWWWFPGKAECSGGRSECGADLWGCGGEVKSVHRVEMRLRVGWEHGRLLRMVSHTMLRC